MESATTLAELLLSDPEILAWLEVNPDHPHERPLLQPAQRLRNEDADGPNGLLHLAAET